MALQNGYYYFPDRVNILVNGTEYFNSIVQSFILTGTFNTTLVHGFTPSGAPAGKVLGNGSIDAFSWEEILPPAGKYTPWREYCINYPGTTIVVIPYTIQQNQPASPQFTLQVCDPTSEGITAPGEGQSMRRSVTFNALYCPELGIIPSS